MRLRVLGDCWFECAMLCCLVWWCQQALAGATVSRAQPQVPLLLKVPKALVVAAVVPWAVDLPSALAEQAPQVVRRSSRTAHCAVRLIVE